MRGHECHHCKQWIAEGEAHDCWTTTEAALTDDLPEDLRDAYQRLRETAVAFGDQRVYASGTAIMFSRASCYFFVRTISRTHWRHDAPRHRRPENRRPRGRPGAEAVA